MLGHLLWTQPGRDLHPVIWAKLLSAYEVQCLICKILAHAYQAHNCGQAVSDVATDGSPNSIDRISTVY